MKDLFVTESQLWPNAASLRLLKKETTEGFPPNFSDRTWPFVQRRSRAGFKRELRYYRRCLSERTYM